MANIELRDLRDRMKDEVPTQWCVHMELAEDLIRVGGFADLNEFITASVQKGGLGMTVEKAKEFMYFNPAYKHKADRLVEVLDKGEQRARRNERIRAMRAGGTTQQAIADELGIAQQTVADVLTGKQSNTGKPVKSKRVNNRQLYIPKSAETAAQKIRDKFGDEFAEELASLLHNI